MMPYVEFIYTSIILIIDIIFFIELIRINMLLRRNEKKVMSDKIHALEVYNKTLSVMYDNTRGFRHDMSNLVLALDGYAMSDNLEGVKKISKAVLNKCSTINKMGVINPQIISNPAIYSIIANKYYSAKEENILMNIEVLTKIDEEEYIYDICRILGILLDNAIEAAKQTNEKLINVKFLKDKKSKRKLIIIENSYNAKDIDVNKIFEKGYTSKDMDSKEHGLGLWNIKTILMNNENLNLFTTADSLFRQQLEIY